MNGLGSVLNRIASVTSTTRTREEDAIRHVKNGGSAKSLRTRELKVVERLERVAEKLEKAIS